MLKWLHGGNAREPRVRRVAVSEAAAVDRRRSIVLVRRDNIEHLLMIGGPTDVVIEPNILRATGAHEPVRPPAPRPARIDTKLFGRLSLPEVPLSPSHDAASREGALTPSRAEPPVSPQTFHNLEELARRLEAALRRSPAPQGRPPVTDQFTFPSPAPAESARPRAQSDAPILELEPRSKPRLDAKPEPKSESKIEPNFAPPKREAKSTLEPKLGQSQPEPAKPVSK
jgi:flagellar protein FliO/FliZ